MGNGERVQVEDGIYQVEAVQKSTFPGARYCLMFDIEGRNGLTSFLTQKDIDTGCEAVQIEDMEITEVLYEDQI